MLGLTLFLLVSGWAGTSAPAGPPAAVYGPEEFAALSETTLVPGCSGVIASRRNKDVYWTHDDSPSSRPRVWAFRLSAADRKNRVARDLGYVELPGASNVNWEDIAAGPGGTIYVFDGGDNPPCRRTGKRIHRFTEPTIDPDGPPVALTAKFDSIRFEYPDSANPARPAQSNDDRYDAECLLVHPVSGDMYVVTKRSNRNKPVARIYKLPATGLDWNSDRVHVLEFVADVSTASMSMVTAGDVSGDGQRVVLRNYWSAFEYSLPPGELFEAIFRQPPRAVPLTVEVVHMLQGEGICYRLDGRELITTTESPQRNGDVKFRVFVVPRLASRLPTVTTQATP